MIYNANYKSVCSVTEIAARLGLSRARFYQLQKMGVFPAPIYCIHTKRPFYPMDLQKQCFEIRKTGVGQNGYPTIFYSKKNIAAVKQTGGLEPKYKELSETLEQMGLKIPTAKIKKAIAILYPDNWRGLDINGEVIAEVFRYFQKGV